MEQPGETLIHHDPDLILRRRRGGDADAMYRAVMESLDHLLPWMPWARDYDRAGAVENAERCEREWETGEAYNYAVVVDDRIVGSISLMRRIAPGGLEIGYWIHPGWTRRGLGRAAAAVLLREAFVLPGTDHVEIHHDAANVASGAIPRALGFTETGRRTRATEAPGETGETVIWRMTRAQYLARRQATRTTAADSGGR
jgi:ribosomal-protein-serine acetyltransferase